MVRISAPIRIALSVFVVAAGLSALVVPQAAHAAGWVSHCGYGTLDQGS